MEDGSVAVSNFSHEVKERVTKDLKDWKADFDKIITSNINLYVDYPTAQYLPRSFVFHQGLQQYMQVKKYDEARRVYTLKPRVKEGLELSVTPSLGDVEAKHDEISDQITIEFRAV
jgi:hypothetical protein